MHKIELVHSWKEIDTTCPENGSWTTVKQCEHCGTKQEVLHLDHASGPTFGDISDNEVLDYLRSTSDRWDKVVQSINEMFRELVQDSGHDSADGLITEIENRCQGAVEGDQLPYRHLQTWIDGPKRYKVKNLLVYFQGLACNRCDNLFTQTVEPTLDHINGDRSNAHPSNLQLLCKDCNGEKGDNPPDQRDRSPFTYKGEVCVHKLTCVELYAIEIRSERATG